MCGQTYERNLHSFLSVYGLGSSFTKYILQGYHLLRIFSANVHTDDYYRAIINERRRKIGERSRKNFPGVWTFEKYWSNWENGCCCKIMYNLLVDKIKLKSPLAQFDEHFSKCSDISAIVTPVWVQRTLHGLRNKLMICIIHSKILCSLIKQQKYYWGPTK